MFVGDRAVNGDLGVPFGGGLRCAGGNVLRLGVQHSGLSGSVSFGPGLMAQTGHAVGLSAHFQTWYRDSNAASYSLGFNTSNGLRVDLVP